MSDSDRPSKRIKTTPKIQPSKAPDDKDVEVRLRPTSRVLHVKRSVKARIGVPLDSQELLLGSAVMQDDASLSTLHPPLAFTLVVLDFRKVAALENVVHNGHEAAVRWLLERSLLQEERREIILGREHLRCAATFGHEGVCQALLGAAPNPEVQGLMMLEEGVAFGETALMAAAFHGHAVIGRLLLGAAPTPQVLSRMVHATKSDGDTALHLAAQCGHAHACRVLFESARDANVRSEMLLRPGSIMGRTALHVAARRGHGTVCRLLLEAAPSPEARSDVLHAQDTGLGTPLDVAEQYGHEMVSQLLRDAAL